MGGSAETEVRQHNGLNQITRIQNGASQTDLAYDSVPGQSNGNLANDGSYAYTWDALNRLVQVNHAGGGFVAAYVYDALNRRIRKSLGATFTDCLYSGWQCVEDRDHSDGLIAQYVWGIYLDEILHMQTYAATGSQGLAAGTYYPLADLLYRTTALTDSTGAIVEAYDTDAYGNTLVFTGVGSTHSWWDPNAVQAVIPACPFIFTGQRFDAETSLYYYKRRYYSTVLGRFLSRDPIGYKGKDFNLYRYCKDDPATLVDPLGTKCRIATRCGPARLSGVPLGTHCGIVVEDDDGTIAIDGSGGNTNTFDIEDPPIPWGTTSAFTDFPDSTCACIKNKVKKWNDLKVPRDSLDANSNWALNCLTGKCGITIPWEKGKEPEGWYGKECVEWRSDMSGPWGPVYTCCKYKPKPCPDL